MSLNQSHRLHCTVRLVRYQYGGGRYVARGPATLLPTATRVTLVSTFLLLFLESPLWKDTRLIRLNPRRLESVLSWFFTEPTKDSWSFRSFGLRTTTQASGFGGVGGWVTHPRLSRSNPRHRTGGTSPTPSTTVRIPTDCTFNWNPTI